jgi:peptidoglycan-N-acetylglucosamine deacetylase
MGDVRRVAWRPSTALQASAGLHAALAAAAIASPVSWPALLAVLAADHLLLAGAGLVPRSTLLGPNLRRLPQPAAARGAVALTFDDGPDPAITPQVLDVLDHYHARATFFCVGERAAAHPQLLREVVRRKHAVENHSHRHSCAFGWYGWRRLQREIGEAQAILSDITGEAPRFFRAPFGIRNVLLEPVLAHAGLQLVSWTRRGYDGLDANAERVLRRLATGVRAGCILLLHDGIATRTTVRVPVTLSVLPRLLDALAERELQAVTLPEACAVEA